MKEATPNVGVAAQYLRRSVERDRSADLDRGAGQKAANAAQAMHDGVTIARTFDADWGVSAGRGKREQRHAMADLIVAIRAGEISTIYVYTTDRLARDVEYGMTLWNACKDAGTIIRPGSQRFDPREPGYLTLWSVLLSQAEEDLDRITKKNIDTQDFGRDHAATCTLPGRPHIGRCHLTGCTDTSHCKYRHKLGRPTYGTDPGRPHESIPAVVAAFREAGSFLGACKLLNSRHVPTRLGRKEGWNVRTVSSIVRRAMIAPPSRGIGVRAGRCTRLFSGLLRCPSCGSAMSSMPRPGGRQVAYYCRLAPGDTSHPRPYVVSEAKLRPWANAEIAEKWRVPAHTYNAPDPQALAAREAEIDARRARIVDAYVDGTMSKAERSKRLVAIEAERKKLITNERTGRTVRTFRNRPFDWSRDPGLVNADLRDLWEYIELGSDLRPVRAVWRSGTGWGENDA